MKKLYKSFKSMMRGETTNSAAAEATTSQEADVARERSSAPSLSPQSELVIHKPIKSFGTASQPDREEVAMDTRADLGHLLSEPSGKKCALIQ